MTASWDLNVDLDSIVNPWMVAIAPDVQSALQATVPVKTTATQQTIEAEATGAEVEATSDKVGQYLAEGTEAHEIEGNPWLFWPGALHPVRRVHHPGTGPDPFIENAIDAGEEAWLEVAGDLIAAAWSNA